MNLTKPVVKFSAKAITIIFLIAGIVMLALGVYLGFIKGQGYEKATAVVTSLEERHETNSEGGDTTYYFPTVKYTVNGTEYEQQLDSSIGKNKLNKEIKIKYDPADPTKVIADSSTLPIYLLAAGAVITVITLFSLIKNKKQVTELKEQQEGPVFAESRKAANLRKLYFVKDLGTAKETCHIEDADRNVLYENVAVKFSLVSDSEYDFVDHEHGKTATHYIGKTATSTSSAFWVLDNHSTFTVDGRDVWKLLHENGITIKTGLDGLKFAYGIYRDGAEIARAVNTNKLVHEEDAEQAGALAKVPSPGFYRITTQEENLDVIFLVLFAIGRTDMMTYR